jgi:hypothetical protein
MKIVVVGKQSRETMQIIGRKANDKFTYVSDIEDTMDAVMENDADIVVFDGQTPASGWLIELLQSLPHPVRLLLMTNVAPYYLVVDNSLKTTINHHIAYPVNVKLEKPEMTNLEHRTRNSI